ncbi:MAG: hypothetical protein H6702_01020 [Myxococcales bacterium]|nr:hypothetical protein [Myxococcales bacterium]
MGRSWVVLGLALAVGCSEGDGPAPGQQGGDATAADGALAPDGAQDGAAGDGALDGTAAPVDAAPTDAATDATLGDDGAVDAAAAPDGGGPSPCVQTVRVGEVEVFAYEASRVDATEASQGAATAADGVCSRAGVIPWTEVTQAEARAACAAVGFHLCGDREWAGVCQGNRGWAYPYGQAHRGGVCNDHVSGSAAVEPTGARAGCVTPEGVHDLAGNVWEMSDGESRWGASYLLNAGFREPYYAGCGGEIFHLGETPFPDVGFRCCR